VLLSNTLNSVQDEEAFDLGAIFTFLFLSFHQRNVNVDDKCVLFSKTGAERRMRNWVREERLGVHKAAHGR
jgi:hypothetical protein